MSDIRKQLDANIPQDVIATRQGGGGKSLSYLETWYVIDRLNQVLGQGNWGYSSEVSKVFEGKSANSYGEVFATSYIAKVNLNVKIGEQWANFEDYGYGDGTDKSNPGKAHELAVKEAVSDGLKRAAKNLGRSMGLALYDKTQEYVGDAVTAQNPSIAKVETVVVSANKTKAVPSNTKESGSAKQAASASAKLPSPTRETIGAAFKVLEAQGKIDKETFKTKYLAGVGLSKLTPTGLEAAVKQMRQDFPALNL